MDTRMLYLHALTPIHSGTGQAAGIVDLPVAREKVLNWPYLPGSSLKGVLRDACRPTGEAVRYVDRQGGAAPWRTYLDAFGPDTAEAAEGAGSLVFADARLLCLPVRSYRGTLAWVSCPLALERWRRDVVSGSLGFGLGAPPPVTAAEGVLVAPANQIAHDGKVYLEDLDLTSQAHDAVGAWATAIASAALDQDWHVHFLGRFAVVSDDVFTFLTETGTEVVARIKLKEATKTVQGGALWYEEAVPSEAIFAAPLLAAPRNGTTAASLFDLVGTTAAETVLQIGGNATVGRGLVRARLGEGVTAGVPA